MVRSERLTQRRSGAGTAGRALALWALAVMVFKLRIVALLLLSAVAGAALGAAGSGSLSAASLLLLLATGGMSAAGASGLNQYLERDLDRLMERTRRRPLPGGEIRRSRVVLWSSIALVVSAVLLAVRYNGALAFFVASGALIYVGVYTLWLKPRTPLNIVIGGAAGSCAVLSGGAAAGAWSDPAVWILALLVLAWTPVHFWSLALAYREDYARAGFPMMPARTTARIAAGWTALHTVLTALSAGALAFVPRWEPGYLVAATAATAVLAWATWRLWLRPDKGAALRLFHVSNFYLAVIQCAILAVSF